MLRRVLSFVLLICLCWQGLAVSGAKMAFEQHADDAHAVMHFEGKLHHHDDHDADNGIHEDASPESVRHVTADDGLSAHALPHRLIVAFGSPVPDSVGTGMLLSIPSPLLDSVERPPRPAA